MPIMLLPYYIATFLAMAQERVNVSYFHNKIHGYINMESKYKTLFVLTKWRFVYERITLPYLKINKETN